jgi:voltage-gated potassium channel Kch
LNKARAVAITFANTPVALKILHNVHQQRPELPVIVRTVDDSEIDRLLEAGATEVVPEVLEGSLMLASHSLLLLGVPLNRVLKRIARFARSAMDSFAASSTAPRTPPMPPTICRRAFIRLCSPIAQRRSAAR